MIEEELNYYKYINSDAWKEKSKKWILEIMSCQKCGSGFKLTCHHKHYRTLGFERKKDIIVLCWNCHKKHHTDVEGKRIFTKNFEKRLKESRELVPKPKTIREWKKKIEKEWEKEGIIFPEKTK